VNGPLNVADLRNANPLSYAFILAARELRFMVNKDFNGAEQEGFGFFQVTQKDGERWSAADAFRCTVPVSYGMLSVAEAELEYRNFRTGPLTTNGSEAGCFLKTRPDLPIPDLQFHFSPGWSVG
jgi:choline dehydrogenase-like flavoprotein